MHIPPLNKIRHRNMKNLYIVCFLVLPICITQTLKAQILDQVKKKGVELLKKEAEKKLKGNNDTKKEGDKKADDKTNKTEVKNEPQTDQQFVVNSKYDFMPGEKVLFFDDFSAENIGDFPTVWNTTGSGEVVTTNGNDGRWFKITNGHGIYTLMEPLTLPENYTIEFDVVPQKDPKNNSGIGFNFYLLSTSKPKDLMFGVARPGGTGMKYSFGYTNYYSAYYSDGTPDQKGIEQEPKFKADKKYRISIWVQKERIRLYVDQTKLFDNPKVISKSVKYNMIRFDGGTPLLGNFRIATGLPDMRSKLLTEGKLISYGIYFDVNKDVVKAESYPSIKEIAAILKDNPNIKIKIVGHTDSDGDDNSNLELSKRRSESVKNALVTNFSIEASRIATDGKGETEPIAPNDNVTNKALNRRVEFIKL